MVVFLIMAVGNFVAFTAASFWWFAKGESWLNQLLRGLSLVVFVWWMWEVAGAFAVGTTSHSVRVAIAVAMQLGVSLIFCLALWALPRRKLEVAGTGEGPNVLIVNGIYRWVRNPLYLAYLSYWLSWVVLEVSSIWRWSVWGLFFALYRLAITQEERFLEGRHGERYRSYCRSVGRLWPRLGMAHNLVKTS